MTIDEAINFVENMIYNYRPHGEQLEDWNKLLNLLRWWREQDLIPRQPVVDMLIENNCDDCEIIPCGECRANKVKQISKAEPPKE